MIDGRSGAGAVEHEANARGNPNLVKRLGRYLETALRLVTEIPAALLIVAEVFLLLGNVFYRYVLRDPLTVGDELASILFIWLAMLGAVIALRRGEHMRLTTFLSKMPRHIARFFETFGNVAVITFMLLLVKPAWQYVDTEWLILTPALQMHDAYRVASLASGFTLMLGIAIARLMSTANARDASLSIVGIGAIASLLYITHTGIAHLGNINLLIFFLGGAGFMVIVGVPIMTAFGLSSLAYLASATHIPALVAIDRMDEGMTGPVLLSIPLFVFLGALIEAMGMASAMIRFLASLIGHLRGGLSYVLIGAMYLVSGISGSKAADMAAVAPALFPEMKKRGEDDGELISMLCASGAMSETIPPSLVLITIGSVTGVSIASLFTGGFLPAIVGAIALSMVVWWKNRKRAVGRTARASRGEIARAFVFAVPALALPFLIRTAVVEGVATATEVATIGVAYTFVVGLLIYRRFDWKRLYPILIDTASLSGAILIIIGAATTMAWALTQSGFSHQLANVMQTLPGGRIGFLIASALAFIVFGSVLEGIPAIVLFGPLLFPIAHAEGVNDVHYAMVSVFAMGLGLFAPPFGVGFYSSCAIGRVDPALAIRKIWPYLGALFFALLVVTCVPWISTGFL